MTNTTVKAEFSELFQGIGVIPGTSNLHLKSDAIPIVKPPRRIPEALRNKVKEEIDRMENNDISKVTQLTDWCNL